MARWLSSVTIHVCLTGNDDPFKTHCFDMDRASFRPKFQRLGLCVCDFFRSDSLRVCWRIRFRTSHFHHGKPFPFWALLPAYCLSNLVKHWSGCPFFWALGPICCLGRFQIDLTSPRLAFVCSMPRGFCFLAMLVTKTKNNNELHALLFYSLFFIILSDKNNIFPHLSVGATPNHRSITQE